MLRVTSLAGEEVIVIDPSSLAESADLAGDVAGAVAAKLDISPFRVRLVAADGTVWEPSESPTGPCDLQVVHLPLVSDFDEELRKAVREGDRVTAFDLLRSCQDPSIATAEGAPLLVDAISRGFVPIAQLLHQARASVDDTDPAGFTALQRACSNGSLEAVHFLTRAGADKEIGDMWGIWPLALACEAGMAEIVRLLVSAGAQTNHASSIDGSTALNRGATLCRPEVVEILIQGRADVNLPDFDASTPLLNSACLDLRTATQVLLAAGADPNCENKYGLTPLHVAAARGKMELLQLILEQSAEVNKADHRGCTALLLATWGGYEEAATILLRASADPDKADTAGCTPLLRAAMEARFALAELLVKAKASMELADHQGTTPLHAAVESSSAQVFKLLLQSRSDVDRQDSGGRTPLYRAARAGSCDALRLLLEARASTMLMAADGASPLHAAAESGCAEAVQLVLSVTADKDCICVAGDTPLLRAAACGSREAAAVLLEAKAEPERANNAGKTPTLVAEAFGHMAPLFSPAGEVQASAMPERCLSRSAFAGSQEVTQLLLEHQADPNVVLPDLSTPLMLAVDEAHLPVAQLLLQHGALTKCKDEDGFTALARCDPGLRSCNYLSHGLVGNEKQQHRACAPDFIPLNFSAHAPGMSTSGGLDPIIDLQVNLPGLAVVQISVDQKEDLPALLRITKTAILPRDRDKVSQLISPRGARPLRRGLSLRRAGLRCGDVLIAPQMPVPELASTSGSFAALSAGSVMTWGQDPQPGDDIVEGGEELQSGVVEITAHVSAFAALKADGTVSCWGSAATGGRTPAQLSQVKCIFHTDRAFAALCSDGSVVCWGDQLCGGDPGEAAKELQSEVEFIFSSSRVFAALKRSGAVVTWGEGCPLFHAAL
eukprot:s334_g15.t4